MDFFGKILPVILTLESENSVGVSLLKYTNGFLRISLFSKLIQKNPNLNLNAQLRFKELSLCKVQHRNQFKMTKLIWIGSAVVYTWLSCEQALIQMLNLM